MGFWYEAQMGLFVQLVLLFLKSSGEYNLDNASDPASEEAKLQGSTQRDRDDAMHPGCEKLIKKAAMHK